MFSIQFAHQVVLMLARAQGETWLTLQSADVADAASLTRISTRPGYGNHSAYSSATSYIIFYQNKMTYSGPAYSHLSSYCSSPSSPNDFIHFLYSGRFTYRLNRCVLLVSLDPL